jgi:CDP-glucose 4,6-dehydratase
MTSLVTGARGFVGGWLAMTLLERGDTVVSFDRRRVTEKPSAVGMLGIEDDLVQVEGDLCDAAELERVLAANGVDTVFHLAAETIVATVQESPVRG